MKNLLNHTDDISAYLQSKGYDCSQDQTVHAAVRNSLRQENSAVQEPEYLQRTSQASVQILPIQDVFIPNREHYDRVEPRAPEGEPSITGVVVLRNLEYRLVDGYHRMKWCSSRFHSGKFIVLE